MTRLLEPLPSIAVAPKSEKLALAGKTQREMEWYKDYQRFDTNDDILAAAEKGELRFVNPDNNIMPIARLRNPELRESFPPYVLPHSLVALKAIGKLWQVEVSKLPPGRSQFRLAVTSLARSEEMQAALVAREDKLASPFSTHCAAASFDIDASGYYAIDSTNVLMPVAHPDRNKQTVNNIAEILQEQVSSPLDFMSSPDQFRPEIPEALLKVADYLHQTGFINSIVEYKGTANQCVHIAPNPDMTIPNEIQ